MKLIIDFLAGLSKKGKIILSLAFGTAMALLMFYIFLPAINVYSSGFWIYLFAVLFFYLLPFLKPSISPIMILGAGESKKKGKNAEPAISFNKKAAIPLALPIAVLIIGSIFSSEFFFARRYASVIDVTESAFSEDMPKTDMAAITNIALMDTDFYKYNPAAQIYPENAILCLHKPTISGRSKNEARYAEDVAFFKAIADFEVQE